METQSTTNTTTNTTTDNATNSTTNNTPTHEQISTLAQILWQLRGSPLGSPEEDWFTAENQLLTQQQAVMKPATKAAGQGN